MFIRQHRTLARAAGIRSRGASLRCGPEQTWEDSEELYSRAKNHFNGARPRKGADQNGQEEPLEGFYPATKNNLRGRRYEQAWVACHERAEKTLD